MNRNKPDMMSSPLQSVEIHFDPAGFGERLQRQEKHPGLLRKGLRKSSLLTETMSPVWNGEPGSAQSTS